MLTKRQQNILQMVVENNIRTAQPVGSGDLVEKLDVSSATIRNEMVVLTEQGYLWQPHTSAGRIPSEIGWQYYVDNFLTGKKKLSNKQKEILTKLKVNNSEQRYQSKLLAKTIGELADAAVMVAWGPRDIFYTGLTNLFSQPEFRQLQSILSISQVIDHLDEVMVGFFNEIRGLEIKVGENNPFSQQCSLLVTELTIDKQRAIFGIMGPWRMDYENNCALLDQVKRILE